jgi:hypothetical protein
MTALDRAVSWFIAPPDPHPAAWPPNPDNPPPRPPERSRAPARPAARSHSTAPVGPEAAPRGDFPAATLAGGRSHGVTRVVPAVPVVDALPLVERSGGTAPLVAGSPLVGDVAVVAPPPLAAAVPVAGAVVSAAVLGRTREVEPVAAALALALRRDTRAKAATVVLIGGAQVESAGRGGAAARRVVARLAGHGLEARVRGRLVWVRLDPGDPELPGWNRLVMLVGAPAVLAVAAPRSATTDEALAEQDLLVLVTNEPEGPLARSAVLGLTDVPVVAAPPLARGPARALACAGLRTTPAVRRLVSPERWR